MRWGSTFDMIDSILINKQALEQYAVKKKKKFQLQFTTNDYELLKSLRKYLGVFKDEVLKVFQTPFRSLV